MDTPASPTTKSTIAYPLMMWVLGGWFFGSLLILFAAVSTFTLLKPGNLRNADKVYKDIPPAQRQKALKYTAGELNRNLFLKSGYGQVAVALLVLILYLYSGLNSRLLLGIFVVNLLMALSFTLYFTPTITELGRQIDFVPRVPPSPTVQKWGMIHGINVVMDLIKTALLLVATVWAIRLGRTEEEPAVESGNSV